MGATEMRSLEKTFLVASQSSDFHSRTVWRNLVKTKLAISLNDQARVKKPKERSTKYHKIWEHSTEWCHQRHSKIRDWSLLIDVTRNDKVWASCLSPRWHIIYKKWQQASSKGTDHRLSKRNRERRENNFFLATKSHLSPFRQNGD